MYLIIDIGGSKVLLGVFDAKGKLIEDYKFATPEDYYEFIDELSKSILQLKTKDFRACGVGVPGKVDRESGAGLAFGNRTWTNVPIQANIEKIVNAPVVIENDANLAGLSEAMLLRGKYKKVLYVTISTGIGGIFVIDGVMDQNTIDAEIGNILLEHKGQLERWEDFASGKAIFAQFGKKVSEIDPKDTNTWYSIARNIAIGLIDLIATLTPDVIVLGGGVGAHFELYGDRIKEQLKIYENPLLKVPPIIKAKHSEEAVLYGGYELVRSRYGEPVKTTKK